MRSTTLALLAVSSFLSASLASPADAPWPGRDFFPSALFAGGLATQKFLRVSRGSTNCETCLSGNDQCSCSGMPFDDRAYAHQELSGDGRFVAFQSNASNLVTNDTNFATDVFVYDAVTGTTERLSVSPNGLQDNARSGFPAISADGRYVAFDSDASNLVAGDLNARTDVFLRDRCTSNGTPVVGCQESTERISLTTNGLEANGGSGRPTISADGRFIAFQSVATNLLPGGTLPVYAIFVRDRCLSNGVAVASCTPSTELVSVASDGNQGVGVAFLPRMSADGQFIAFQSDAANLVIPNTDHGTEHVFVRDRAGHTTGLASVASDGTRGDGTSNGPVISGDGRFIAFNSDATNLVPGDTNATTDIFIHDRIGRTTERVSVSSDGAQAVPMDPSNPGSEIAAVSFDGRLVAFESDACNLISGNCVTTGDTNGVRDVFLRDRMNGTTQRVSVRANGAQAAKRSFAPAISADGTVVAFQSDDDGLVAGDMNGVTDVFREVLPPPAAPVCGNGVLEGPEQCEMNPSTHAFDSCCDPSSCMIRPSGSVCRPSRDSTCDFTETCDGTSSSCAADSVASPDTACVLQDPCTIKDHCAEGQCVSGIQVCDAEVGQPCVASRDLFPCQGSRRQPASLVGVRANIDRTNIDRTNFPGSGSLAAIAFNGAPAAGSPARREMIPLPSEAALFYTCTPLKQTDASCFAAHKNDIPITKHKRTEFSNGGTAILELKLNRLARKALKQAGVLPVDVCAVIGFRHGKRINLKCSLTLVSHG